MLAYVLLGDSLRQSVCLVSQHDLMVVKVSPDALLKHSCHPRRQIVCGLASVSHPRWCLNLQPTLLLWASCNSDWLPEGLLVREHFHECEEISWFFDQSLVD